MRNTPNSVFFVVATLLLSSIILAAKVVHIDIAKTNRIHSSIAKRSQTGVLNNQKNLYSTDILVGSPGQKISVQVDTGSGDLWIFNVSNPLCQNGGCLGGTFDPSKSSTFVDVQPGGFSVQYVFSFISGDWMVDNFELPGGPILKSQAMGLATNTTISEGIMGVSYNTNGHPNVVGQMVLQNLINSQAYGIYLNDYEASTGEILFGGIDTQKYIGPLTTLAISGNVLAFQFTLSWLSLDDFPPGSQATIIDGSTSTEVFLDTGTTVMALPDQTVAIIVAKFGAVNDIANSGYMYVSCDLRCSEPDAFFTFGLGTSNSGSGPGPVVRVPLSEVILDWGLSSPYFKNTCLLAIFPSSATGGYNILGDTFLRSAYVVYDLDNHQVAVAQANFGETGSNIVEITKGALPTPSGVQSGNKRPAFQCSSLTTFATTSATQTSTSITTSSTPKSAPQTFTTSTKPITPTPTESTATNSPSPVCIAGTGPGNYIGLCSFCCNFGYCPPGPCTCTAWGNPVPTPPTTGVNGYPLQGEDDSYLGLCSFACNHNYCPGTACRSS